jgi:hypothetical protein
MSHGFQRRSRKQRRKQRNEKRPNSLLAPISPITGQEQMALQTPIRSDIRRISTASLIREIQRRPEAQALMQAIAEANAQSADQN